MREARSVLGIILSLTMVPAFGSTPKAMLKGINTESCKIEKISEHQKDIFRKYAYQPTALTEEDLLRVEFAKITLISEHNRMAVLKKKYLKLTGKELTLEHCE